MKPFNKNIFFFFAIFPFFIFGKNYVKLNLPEKFDLVSTHGVAFGFEYSSKKNNIKKRGLIYDYPMSLTKFRKFDLHLDGKPYRGSHKALQISSSLLHKTSGVIPVSYKHPLNPEITVKDTLLFPYPKEIGLDLKSISFSSPESVSLLVYYTNGMLHKYSYENVIKFLDSYGMNLQVKNGSLAYGKPANRYYSIGERVKIDKLETTGFYSRHFTSRTVSYKVQKENLFDVILRPVDFEDHLIGGGVTINLVSEGYETTFDLPLLHRGNHEVSFRGRNGRSSSFSSRGGARGERSPDVQVTITAYNDSLFRYTVNSSDGEREYVLNPRFARLNVSTTGGNGSQGACGLSGANASGNSLYGEHGGNGSDGADGGDGGDINIYFPRSFLPHRSTIIARSKGGKGGSGGRAGSGGRHKNKSSSGCILYAEDGYCGNSGRHGRNGRVNFQVVD